jgi:NADPH:quinone reductase-like Zn-dependent oxidoreductase
MKAAIIKKYGDSSHFIVKQVDDPKIDDNEVLIKIIASAVNPIDYRIRSGSVKYILPHKFPAILGFDLAGEVIELGSQIKNLKLGDAVYVCSSKKGGRAYAELIAHEASELSLKPSNMTFEQAASVPLAALTALQALRDKGNLKPKQRILIIGASGGVGMFSVQLAKAMGGYVVGVCSKKNIDFVNSLGADEVINYQQNSPFSGKQSYDIIFDCVAAHKFSSAKEKLTPKGVYITTVPNISVILSSLLTSFCSKKVKIILLKKNKNDLDFITQLIESNKIQTHIDSQFSLDDIAKAHQQIETHRCVGKVVISNNPH